MSGKRLFFIRGFMKSGTNWLAALLNRHPEVSSVGEFHWNEVLSTFIQQADLPVYSNNTLHKTALAGLRRWIMQTIIEANDPLAIVVGDRTPCTVDPVIDFDGYHLSIIRDGRDVTVSRIFHLFNNPGVTRVFRRNENMAALLDEFRADPWFFQKNPDLLLSHEEIVRHSARWWKEHLETDRKTIAENPELKFTTVHYESLHANTIAECERLFRFLEVDPALAAPLDEHTSPGFSVERPDHFFRKGAIGDWKIYFGEKQREWFVEEAGEELIRQGYVTQDGIWDSPK